MSVVSNAIVQQMRNRFGNGQQGGDGESAFNETVTFVIPGIDHMTDEQVQDLAAKILDAAKDAGLVLGFPNDQNPYVYNYNSYRPQVVHFRVSDIEGVRQRAIGSGGQRRPHPGRADGQPAQTQSRQTGAGARRDATDGGQSPGREYGRLVRSRVVERRCTTWRSKRRCPSNMKF